jgi:dephospho-CoA kinase
MLRDGIDEAAARARIAAQMPLAEKRRRATWVIDNAGSPDSTAEQVGAWWERWVHPS